MKGWSYLNILKYKIESFVDLSHIIGNGFTVDYQEFNLGKFINKIHKIIQPLINPSVTFEILKDGRIGEYIVYDEERLFQIVIRLLLNAFKYTSHGYIKFTIMLCNANELRFIVNDTGSGITKEAILDIQKSSELIISPQSKKNIKLGGLGLATIQLILEKMGSSLEIQTTLGKGSEFSFDVLLLKKVQKVHSFIKSSNCVLNYRDKQPSNVAKELNFGEQVHLLPISKLKKPKLLPQASLRELSYSKSNDCYNLIYVMVVDDDSLNRKVHKLLLAKYNGIIVTDHQNGLEAVEYISSLKSKKPNKIIILMDINMPVMDGMDASRKIREMTLNCAVKIIAVSAFSEKEEVQRILKCGIDYYVTKPLSKAALEKIMSLYCFVAKEGELK